MAASGLQVVVGFNDFNGFGSGAMYSTDGGNTFTYYGLLPANGPVEVLGDPSLAVWNPPSGPPVFYYASLFLNRRSESSLCIHRSTDGGASWDGPFEVTSAPIGTDVPDREWLAVDPETGRLFISWTHFGTPFGMKVSYSDDAATGSPPTWSAATVVGARPQDGQSSFLAADPGGPNVYMVWESYPYTVSGNAAVAFAKSTDNGVSWSAPVDVVNFWHHVSPWGFDRWLWSMTGMALNPLDGGIEVVYAASQNGTPSGDFGDIFHIRTADGGATWSSPQVLNVFPGTDRPQCFPTVAAASNGRLDAYWYDLSAGTGRSDWTDFFHAFSTDFGTSWSSPVPTTPAPFHNESGNDYGWPHQGDYIHASSQALAIGAFAWMNAPFPGSGGADAAVAIASGAQQVAPLRVRPGTVGISDAGCQVRDGLLTANEYGYLDIPLENIGRTALTGVVGTLSALSANVTVVAATQNYGSISSGASASLGSYVIRLGPAYPCGQPAQLRLDLSADGVASTWVELSIPTGVTASSAVVLSENFDGVTPPTLPAGWSTLNPCPTCGAAPWSTSSGVAASPPNAAFAPENSTMSFGRLQGPNVAVPASADFVDVTFDVAHQLFEWDARYAPSGVSFAYLLDNSGASRFATADATEFDYPYTHNISRGSGDGAGDRSAWSGLSGPGPLYQQVRVRIPGLGGHSVRPRFDLTTEGPAVGGGGARVDNVQITAVDLGCGTCVTTAVATSGEPPGPMLELLGPNPFVSSASLRYTLPEAGLVRLEVLGVDGRRVRSLVDRFEAAGTHTAALVLRGAGERHLAPGVYFVLLVAGSERKTLRVVALE